MSSDLDLERLRDLASKATPGPWRSRKGYGPDKFAPKGYRYVLFGPGREEMYGTDQLKPEDADFIVAAVNFVRDLLAAVRGEPGLDVERLASGIAYAMVRTALPGSDEISRDYANRLAPLVIESGYLATPTTPEPDQ